MNPQVQEVKKIMSRVNKKKNKKHRHIKVKTLKIKKKGCQEKKKNSNILHSDVLGFKKRSANIEFYTQLNYNCK